MNAATTGSPSIWMALVRILVGIMFLFFAQYKLVHRDFAHGGYEKYVQGYVQETSVDFYKPVLRMTLRHPVLCGYTVGVTELLIGLSLVLGWWTRTFSIIGALFMLNLTLATWHLPPGSAYWRYLGNELDNIPLLMLFIVFIAHRAGQTLGMDK
jgi:thiosulfate dehydrogenase (quinone) large subunit